MAYDRLDRFLGLRPERPVAVVIYDPRVFDARFAGFFRFAAAGFYSGTIRIRGDTKLSSSLVQVLHHELVHAAFDAVLPSTPLPAWLNEGLAEWFEARALGKRRLSHVDFALLRDASRRGVLHSLAALSSTSLAGMGPESARLAYVQSYGFFEHLARRHGERALRELCLEIQRTGAIDRSFQRAFRALPARLFQGFAAELRAG